MRFLGNRSVLLLVMAVLLSTGPATSAQQDGEVTVIIKAKPNPATLPTLLVMCDLACDWKLDSESKGHIDAGKGAKVNVEPGQHMVEATTEDGVDQVKQPSTVKPTGQTMVSVELWPIRYTRLVAEQEARDAAAQEQSVKEQAGRGLAVRQEGERLERERIARDEAAGVWTDPATGLMWTKKDNGDGNVTTEKQAKQYDLTWQQAVDYCWNLRIGGYSDWRLPTIDELGSIFSGDIHTQGECCGKWKEVKGYWHIKGNLQLTGNEWSKTEGDPYHKEPWKEARLAEFFNEDFKANWLTEIDWEKSLRFSTRALCVRNSGD